MTTACEINNNNTGSRRAASVLLLRGSGVIASIFARDSSFLQVFAKSSYFRSTMFKPIFCRVVSKTYPSLLRNISSTRHLRADPWPLPNTPEHLASTATSPNSPPPEPLLRPNEKLETMRARLVYQSRKRGTLESDLLLSTFAKDNLSLMDETEMKEYDKVCIASSG